MSDFSSTSHSAARQPAARITGRHGYFIDGDSIHLNADIEWTDREQASSGASAWALQLWARPAFAAANADSIKVAELPLSSGSEGRASTERVEGWGFALPPAGTEAYTMVLELRGGDGQLHDQVAFARSERFVQPRLGGIGGYRFDGGQVRLEVDRVENPRAIDNLSGSLALELWAADEPYRGGELRGQKVGGASLGRLSGQADWSPVGVDVAANALPAGRWYLSLMLREWSAAGWVTRDYIGFAAPHHVDEAVPPSAAGSAIEPAPASVAQPVADSVSNAVPESPMDASAIPSLVTSALAAAAAAMKDAPAVAVLESATQPAAKARKPAVVAAVAPKPKVAPKSVAVAPATVSINSASEAELTAVKGLPKAAAKAIVAARPHASLDSLLNVKGIGPKLLDKLRGGLRI